MRKRLLLISFVVLTLVNLKSQNHKWEVGPTIGISNYFGDIIPSNGGDFSTSKFAFGGFLRLNLHPNIALRGSILRGSIGADDRDYDALRRQRGFNFSSPLTEGAIRVELDLFGHRRYPDSLRFRKILSPYVFAGIGAGFFNPDTDYNIENNPNRLQIQRDQDTKTDKGYLVVPFGGGLKLDLSDRWTAGLELSLVPPFTDLIDGVSQSGDPSDDDWYAITSATLAYRFGSVDSDKDGVPDERDKCPKVPGIKSLDGCPDSDLDGVVDGRDDCPYEKGIAKLKGCPDRDNDGIADKDDSCPDEAGLAILSGCPEKDADGDGIKDGEDECPNEAGIAAFNGCPDTDNDGIRDSEDQCPNEAGTVAFDGCPDPDRDKDGILNQDDECPDEPGSTATKGCPDRDGDGIADKDDKCPEVAGTTADGCAEITKEDEETLNFAAKNVFFDTDLATIRQESFAKLDEIVDIMRRYQNYNVNIEGYTDNRGNDIANQQLSERRAQACYNYLVNKGIDRGRITFKGLGETNPVATNNTVAGRQQNRRVEFKLVKQD